MKNTLLVSLSLIVLGLCINGCNSSKKMLQRGNYYQAVMSSIEKLRTSPNNDKARNTLSQAYPLAVGTLMDKIDSEKASRSDFQFTQMVYIFQDLNAMYESIQRAPAAKEVVPNAKKYYSQLANIKPKAAQEQYLAGTAQLNLGTRESAKQAYFSFLEADKFVPGFKDVNKKIEKAYNLAILKVVARLKPIKSRRYNLSANIFYDEVRKVLREIEKDEFIRFLTPKQAKKRKLNKPDQYLVINFEDFIVGETHTQERIEKLEKDSVLLSTITLDDGKKRDVLGTVKAELNVKRMEVISKGIINLTITHGGFDKRVLMKQDFGGQYVWYNEWGHFNGDERALNDEQLAICNAQRIAPLPPQQMFIEFTRPIHAKLRNRLIRFYKRY
ncbi:MAG: hypothetical protein ABJF11_19835 [Reichenbachiella sp.]|uniref:hypothetical protein n=1 Tax=Reichenbachiella sp. TaxID=2184521 RepID=UPI003266F45B